MGKSNEELQLGMKQGSFARIQDTTYLVKSLSECWGEGGRESERCLKCIRVIFRSSSSDWCRHRESEADIANDEHSEVAGRSSYDEGRLVRVVLLECESTVTYRLGSLVVKRPASHGVNPGSNPGPVILCTSTSLTANIKVFVSPSGITAYRVPYVNII